MTLDTRGAYRKQSQAGITLLEVLLVLTLLILITGLAVVANFQAYRGFAFHGERNVIVNALQKARSEAISNVCLNGGVISCSDGVAHGVHFGTGQYVIFQGASYNAADTNVNEVIPSGGAVTTSCPFSPCTTDIMFSQLSGQASFNPVGSITLTGQTGQTSVITVNSEGQIVWTN